MDKTIKTGDRVQIKPNHYDAMVGTVVRITKVIKPFGPESNDPSDWTYHVEVNANHPRNSGMFQLSLKDLTKV